MEDTRTPIQKAIDKCRELREAGILPQRRPLDKFIENPRIGRAVKMFCYECNGYSRKLANECETKSCPLWLFRKGKHTPDQEELEAWRASYTEHMRQAGEFSETIRDVDDIDDDIDDPEEDEEEPLEE